MTPTNRINAYSLIDANLPDEFPYRKYPAQPRRNRFTSPTISFTLSHSRERTVNSRILSRACVIALSEGQRAKNTTPLVPVCPELRTRRW